MNDTNILGESILGLIAEDKDLIVYRKSLRQVGGSVTATILLQQIIHRMKGKDRIYKFKTPCNHKLYKPGDSWTEELGFSIKEFDTALRKIGTKISKDRKKEDVLRQLDPNAIILYWTDRDRVTWYELNKPLLNAYLSVIYLNDQTAFSKITKGDLLKYLPKGHLHDLTETNSETNSENNSAVAENGNLQISGAPEIVESQDDFSDIIGEREIKLPDLTEADKSHLQVFGFLPGNEPKEFDAIQEIRQSGWNIRDPIVEQGIAHFIEAIRSKRPTFAIPNNTSIRKDWYTGIAGHLQDYTVERLPSLYIAAIDQLDKSGMSFARPGSLTKTLADVVDLPVAAETTIGKDGSFYV